MKSLSICQLNLIICVRYEKLQNGVKHFDNDGLNSLKYKVIEIKKTPLYIRIHVDINQDQTVSVLLS